MRRLVICMLVLGSVMSLDLSTSLLSMDLNDVALLDTTSMSCATPQNEFERVSAQMAAWADIVQHKDSLHRDIQRLEGIKGLIEKRKFKTLEKQLEKLELPKTESRIGEPILAEFKHQLKGLSNPETADQCEATLLKLCIYLLKQFNSCRQQCTSNPVTVIKIKGKIKDLQVVQQSCGQPAPCEDEPGLPDEPTPVVPDEPTPVVPDEPTPVVPDEPTPVVPDEPTPVVPDEPTPVVPDEPTPVVPDEPTPVVPGEPTPVVPGEPTPPVPEEPTPVVPDEPTPIVPDEPTPVVPDEPTPVVPGEPTPSVPEEETPSVPEEEQSEPSEEETVTPPDEEQITPSEEETPEEFTEEPVDEPPADPNHEESPEEPVEEEAYEENEEIFEEFEEPPIVPPVVPPIEVVEKTCLNSVNEIVYTASVDEASPLVNKQLEGEDLSCYGFGFYAKWLQAYPTYLVHGRQDEKYFVARITESEHPSGQVTDDTLSVFLTREGLEFQSYDGEGTTSTIINVGDVEGQWIYVYYSYCDGRAVAVVNENGQTSLNSINVSHNTPQSLYFQLAGQSGDIKSFQGQFTLVQSNVGSNTFIETPEEAIEFVFNCNQLAQTTCERQISNLHEFEFKGKDSAFDASTTVENSEPIFAQEYSVSGWFKWYPVQDQASWHTAFRLTLNNVATNQNAKQLGDRDLALFVGNEHKDSILAFTTYTYQDLYGNGNPTYWQAVPYEKDLVHWHYIYFGYSRHIQKAYGFVEFFTRKGEVHFENVKHFDAPHKYLFVGQDQFYPSYNGKIFGLHYNLCEGSYRELKYDEHWGYTPKPTDPVPPPPPEVPESEPEEQPEEPSEEEWTPPPPPSIPEETDEPPYEETIVVPPPDVPEIPDEPVSEEEEPVSEEEQPPVVPPSESVSEEEDVPPVSEEEEVPPVVEPPVSEPEEVPEPPVESEEEVPEPPVEPTPEPTPLPPVEPTPEPTPQPPAPVPQPQCPPTIEVNKDNAADILCELSHYLGEFAQGHSPATGANLKKVCFCMTYNEDYAPPTLLQLASKIPGHIQLNEPKVAVPLLKKFIKQRQ